MLIWKWLTTRFTIDLKSHIFIMTIFYTDNGEQFVTLEKVDGEAVALILFTHWKSRVFIKL